MSKLINEAIADANAVQAVAEERAKSMLIKEFSPKIKNALVELISAGSDQPGGYNPEEDQDAVGATVPAGQNSDDLAQDGSGPEKIKEEEDLPVDAEKDDDGEPVLEDGEEDDEEEEEDESKKLKEDGEEDEEEEEEEDEAMEPAKVAPKAPEGDDEVLEIVDDDEPADTDEIPPSVDEEDEVDDDEKDVVMETLKRKNRKLIKQNVQLREAVGILHRKFNKINLFNAKLAYAFKLLTHPGLSHTQKRQIAETFDSAKSVRETQLIYKTLKAGLSRPQVKKNPLQNKSNVKSVISESTQQKNAGQARMSELAGL